MKLEQAVKIASASSNEIRRSDWLRGDFVSISSPAEWVSISLIDTFSDDWEVHYRVQLLRSPWPIPANDDYPWFNMEIAAIELAEHRYHEDCCLLTAVMDLYQDKEQRAAVIRGWRDSDAPYSPYFDSFWWGIGYFAGTIYDSLRNESNSLA